MNRPQRTLTTIRIVVLLLVGLAFLIARFVHAQQPTAAELAKKVPLQNVPARTSKETR